MEIIKVHEFATKNPEIQTETLESDFEEKIAELKQVKCIEQIVYNLCGYHAIFNLIQLAGFLKTGDGYFLERLLDSKVFWQFHFIQTKF